MYYEEKYLRPKYEEEKRIRKRRICGKKASVSYCSSSAHPVAKQSSSVYNRQGISFNRDRQGQGQGSNRLGGFNKDYQGSTSFDELPEGAMADFSLDDASELMESLSTDAYEPIEEKNAKNVFTAPTSTFRMTTSNASMGIVFNQIRSERRVDMDQVRIEEVLNYFDYDTEASADAKFSITTELMV